jgi:hypothetical protein
MPTPAQVANRHQAPRADRHMPATIVAAGPPAVVALDPGGAQTTAVALSGATYALGARVLVVITARGNWIIGGLP